VQDLCLELNIRSASEQQEFCLCYILEAGMHLGCY
jgi:hypothetical protein